MKDNWIDIKDDQPEEFETVWAYDQDNDYIYLACMVYTEGQWWWAISNSKLWVDNGKITAEAEIVDAEDYNITHWQPLPELPKKQAP